jgi:hypothetical protein
MDLAERQAQKGRERQAAKSPLNKVGVETCCVGKIA